MVCARTALTLRRRQQRGDDRVGDLVLDNVGRLAGPAGMNDHLHVRDVGQGVERNVAAWPRCPPASATARR